MRLGVLGGTFDPVHNGHLRLAECAREDTDIGGLDLVLFVPAGQPWRKADRAVTESKHRLAMLQLAVAHDPSFSVSSLELDREGPSYTVDTLRALGQRYDGADLYLIMGEDALADMPNWREPECIVQLATLAVALRQDNGPSEITAMNAALPGLRERVVRVSMEYVHISSSMIRERVRRGESITDLVPAAVESYIRDHGLYRR